MLTYRAVGECEGHAPHKGRQQAARRIDAGLTRARLSCTRKYGTGNYTVVNQGKSASFVGRLRDLAALQSGEYVKQYCE